MCFWGLLENELLASRFTTYDIGKVKRWVLTASGSGGWGLGGGGVTVRLPGLLLICRFKSDCKCQTWSTLELLFQMTDSCCHTAIKATAQSEQGQDLKGSTANRFNVCTCVLALSRERWDTLIWVNICWVQGWFFFWILWCDNFSCNLFYLRCR